MHAVPAPPGLVFIGFVVFVGGLVVGFFIGFLDFVCGFFVSCLFVGLVLVGICGRKLRPRVG